MGDLSIDKPFNKAVSSNVVIEHDSGLVQLTSVFDFNLSGVLTHVSLTSKKMFPNEKNNIEGTGLICLKKVEMAPISTTMNILQSKQPTYF